jgi:hypothetical protein
MALVLSPRCASIGAVSLGIKDKNFSCWQVSAALALKHTILVNSHGIFFSLHGFAGSAGCAGGFGTAVSPRDEPAD